MSALAMSFLRPTPTIDNVPNGSKGCGAVMRSAPFGIALATREEAFRAARDAGVLTHGHPSGYLAGAYLASLVFDLVRGIPLVGALANADALLAHEREHEELAGAVQQARMAASKGLPTVAMVEALGGGWVGEEALAIGLACALSCGSPGEIPATLWRALAHAGDSDSTGSIAGNLVGAFYGLSGLPARWLGQLELRAVIERAARDLFESSVLGSKLGIDDYPHEHGRWTQHP
jgi:ADP-ribosylglycohydrolase